MAKHSNENRRIKKKYLDWRKLAKGHSEASIDKAAAAVDLYLDWIGTSDLRQFHSEKAAAFKRSLSSQKNAHGRQRGASTINGILRELRAFFAWLADQPGYRSRIRHSDAAWFSPDRASDAARHGGLWKPSATPQQITHAIRLMPSSTVLERRDRALVAFLYLTGVREKTAMTVRLQHLDLANNCVHLDGHLVSTKFSKRFTVAFFPVSDDVRQVVCEWAEEMRNDHLRGPADPLFPKTEVGIGPNGGFIAIGLDNEAWRSPARVVKVVKSAFAAAGFPTFGPHSIRRTLIDLANAFCKTPEEFKAWSQNVGHEDVLTTFQHYGSVGKGRQMELFDRMRRGG